MIKAAFFIIQIYFYFHLPILVKVGVRTLDWSPFVDHESNEKENMRMINLLAWAMLAVVAGLTALNWSTLMISAPLNLVVAQIQAPLGGVLLGLFVFLAGLFFVAYLHNQINSLIETRRLLKEIQQAHDLADKAEASRTENLHQFISTEFRLLNERLNTGIITTPIPAGNAEEDRRPWSLTELVTGRERQH